MFIILTIELFVSLFLNVWLLIGKIKSKKEINRLNRLSFVPPIEKSVYTPDSIRVRRRYTREELYRRGIDMMDMESEISKVYFKEFAKRELMDRVIEYAEIRFDVDHFRQQVEATAEIKVLRPGE